MKLSILIPVYNERKNILEVLKRVKKADIHGLQREIIIVDDFSTDGTRDILEKLNEQGIKIFFHRKNQGKGRAIRTALEHATGDIIMVQDADLEYDPGEYPKLLAPILDGKTKVVYGSRMLNKKNKSRYFIYYLGNVFLSWVTRLLYFRKITAMETCYKIVRREVLKNIKLKSNRFDIEPEITAKIIKKGYKIIEVPISYKCRPFNDGKKINWKDGVVALLYLFKYRFFN